MKTDLYLIISWNLIIFSLLFILDLIREIFFIPFMLNGLWDLLYFLAFSLLASFIINLYVGFILFKTFHKENKRDNVIIILLIVIVEYIVDNLILYPFTILFG